MPIPAPTHDCSFPFLVKQTWCSGHDFPGLGHCIFVSTTEMCSGNRFAQRAFDFPCNPLPRFNRKSHGMQRCKHRLAFCCCATLDTFGCWLAVRFLRACFTRMTLYRSPFDPAWSTRDSPSLTRQLCPDPQLLEPECSPCLLLMLQFRVRCFLCISQNTYFQALSLFRLIVCWPLAIDLGQGLARTGMRPPGLLVWGEGFCRGLPCQGPTLRPKTRY